MIKNLIIILSLLFCSTAHAIDVQDNTPVITKYDEASVPVLNDTFRQNNKRLQAIEEAFGGSDYLGVSSGGTGIDLTTITAGYALFWDGSSVVGQTINSFPVGGIIMWSGAIADIPTGWALCDGTNGTVDLRDRFIVGATQDSAGVAMTNVTGSLTKSGDGTIPAHTHTVPGDNAGATGADIPTFGKQAASLTTASGSSGAGTKNIAVYYALAFIQKT